MIYDSEVPPAENIFNHHPLKTIVPMKEGKTIGQGMDFVFPGFNPGSPDDQGRPGSIVPTASENQPVRFVIQNMTFSLERPMATFPVGEVIESIIPTASENQPVRFVIQ